ncbi:MAG: nickel pincer cofactor biosynthesis protein LarC [Nitrospira sp.]|nr:nickel pincer cofactor biosynthesis protein LarC [Nitrospira sp.]
MKTDLKIAYLDCSSGISGDMCLGATVDAGVPIKRLGKELSKIPVEGYTLSAKKVKRAGFSSTKLDVIQKPAISNQQSAISRWEDIEEIIQKSSLSPDIKQKGLKIFKIIFEAEAKVHGEAFNKVHLHELGAIDCLVDIFGTIIGLDILGIEKVYSSPINLGSGSVKTEHGILPVPAPATAEILKGLPVYSTDIPFELTTPTGAAILKGLSPGFGSVPPVNIEKIGIGAGSKDFKNRPNILRLFIGNPLESPHTPFWKSGTEGDLKGDKEGFLKEKVTIIETNIDDMDPQLYEYVMEKLFKAGALDVYLTNIFMKKGRPGIKLSLLCNDDRKEDLIKIVLKETSTIGLRFHETRRKVLHREIKTIDTEFGKVRVKFSRLGNEILKACPEYEDCKRIAKKLNIPLIEVMRRIKF